MTRCWFVDDHRADYPVKRLCELVELRRATFYWWAIPTSSQRVVDDTRLANEIVEVHQAWVCRAL